MDDLTTLLLILVLVAAIGSLATVVIMRRERRESEKESAENPFATSTEGMSRCPSCGFGYLAGEVTCSSCGERLPD
jgi:hypothetical protein